ncbi:MAG: helix-turn-helix transcriptional regulator [Aliidongia sp.]
MRAYSISPRPIPEPRPRTETLNGIRDVNRHVARRLKLLRVIKGCTQTDLGQVVGLTHQQMAKYERGISKIVPSMLWKLAGYFQVDIGFFFEDLDQTMPGIDSHIVARRATQNRLRLELVAALGAVTDDSLLRGLRDFLRASHGQDCAD